MSVYTCIWRPEINFEFRSLLILLLLSSWDRVCHWAWSSLLQRGCRPVWSRGLPVLLVQLRIAYLDCHYFELYVIACEASTFPSNPLIHPPYQVLRFVSSLLWLFYEENCFKKCRKGCPGMKTVGRHTFSLTSPCSEIQRITVNWTDNW